MSDTEIIQFFLNRNQQASEEAQRQYGRYCLKVAKNILQNAQDSEECSSDALLGAWNSIPPTQLQRLGPFGGKITQNLALGQSQEQNYSVTASLEAHDADVYRWILNPVIEIEQVAGIEILGETYPMT